MKKNSFAFIVLLNMLVSIFIVPSFAQTLPAPANFLDLTLEITSTKQEFVQLEPIPLILKLSNKTQYPIVARTALDLSAGFIELYTIRENGEPVKIQNLTPIRGLVVVRPGTIKPGESFQTKELLTLDLDKIFRQAGSYQIDAVLRNGEGKQEIKSNRLTARIVEPVGLDLQPFNYIKKYANPSYFFSGLGLHDSKQAQDVLKGFVVNFRDSSYGDYGALRLGSFYFVRKEFANAIGQLNGIAYKIGFVHADRCLYYLVQAHAKLGDLIKARSHLDALKSLYPESRYVKEAEIFISQQKRANR